MSDDCTERESLTGYTTWPNGDPIPPPLRQIAAEIIAFDVLIDNADRRPRHPNILYKNDEILVIDHETAFALTRLIGNPSGEWTVDRIKFIYEHLFYPGLRGQALQLDRFASNVARLTDQGIAAISAAVPDGFGRNKANRWLGRAVNLQGSEEDFKLYLLLGKPSGSKPLMEAFHRAERILRKMPIYHDLVLEDDAPRFAKQVEADLREHEEQESEK